MLRNLLNNIIFQSVFLMTILILMGIFIPNWLVFVVTKAIAYGLVGLGIITLMRGGLVSFGQGFVFGIGGYTAGLLGVHAGLTDAILLLLISFIVTGLVGLVIAPLLARYRDIFFAMLSLAFSMVLYGILIKIDAIGGSDGFVLPESTYFGIKPTTDYADYILYVVSILVAGFVSILLRYYYNSTPGLIALAVRESDNFNHENVSNEKLVVSNSEQNDEILKSVLIGSGQKAHKDVVALNTSLVLWVAGIENDLHEGFKKALSSINKGNPWNNFLSLKTFLSSNE